ncbi:MAG: bifunctional methylenetetrahydrofolate dehydrogenase/methenyltetrahydrofolate cyclohydrolase FolD [Deltaproteobacteria bacterium]|nr:bifunctional methylenetetrahydrofolate dehydrogenase/methenyltetrahydrofolate cyclohydrolase FolD [Deltaproteobacteria bacterium]
MQARILDGKAIAAEVRAEWAQHAAEVHKQRGRAPSLAVVLVGEDPASKSYVRGKRKAAAEMGILSRDVDLPADTPEAALRDEVDKLNADPAIDAILVQLPLPAHVNADALLERIQPAKDADGFHPVNLGRMLLGQDCLLPCTPAGVMEILGRSQIKTQGTEVVIVGRSRTVGRPLANMLSAKSESANATVTLCHSATIDLAKHCRQADILIAAAGQARIITADMIKPGATVIDVGIHRIGTTPKGRPKLCGDVDFDTAKEVASAITPVPGGVGPMTIAMLMRNTVLAARK